MLAKKNIYLDEAYKQFEVISQDQQKRLEYTARMKAIYDYNTLKEESLIQGRKEGKAEERANIIQKLRQNGFTDEEINTILSTKV